MKVLEKLVLAHLELHVSPVLDLLQYSLHLGVDDADVYLLQLTHSNLDGGGGTVRISNFAFSSANTIQLLLLNGKLPHMGVCEPIISWITDYLRDRSQFVHLDRVLYDVVVSGIGVPQVTVPIHIIHHRFLVQLRAISLTEVF